MDDGRSGSAAAHDAWPQGVLDIAPIAIVGVAADGNVTYVNPHAETTFGYARHELLGQPVERLLPGDLSGRHVAHRASFADHPAIRAMRHRQTLAGRRKDGSTFAAEISLSPMMGAAGVETFAIIADVSDRDASARGQATELRFRAVLDASPNPIVAVGGDGVIIYVNPQAERTFRYAHDELIGQSVELLLPDRVSARHVAHREGFVGDPRARPMGIGLDLAGRRKDGSEFPVEISLSPVPSDHGIEVFATVVDITARKASEMQLLQAQKLESIGRLAGGIAHDFNNMLFAIRGFAEMLGEDLAAEDRSRFDHDAALKSVAAINAAADRAAGLTAQLLAFGRRQPVDPRSVDLNAAVHAVEPMLRRLIGEQMQLALSLDPSIGTIRVDPGQIDQILVNLVVNARDAMPEGGTVVIATNDIAFDESYAEGHFELVPGRYVQLVVSDNGVGMDREVREHIFEPFFTTKELGKGTGLGLATIYGIVGQAGGHIWLYSEPGQGSTFKLYFPRHESTVEAAAHPPVARPVERRTGTVLLVEDEVSVRDMTTLLLERAGFTVVAVPDGMSALARIAEGTDVIDVLITDVVMPGISGVQLAERMIAEFPEVGLVLVSGYLAETLDLSVVTSRGARFVSKPVGSRELLAAVDMAIAGAGRRTGS